ncbi:MAG: hypothetical protein CR982_01100 [Candidatus Cloacimonadota bacterium]|nr:MAG: hypothetical protein CR982_01100 [Candidatus Cloacimonadota bacterium]PIE78133.1 MAG: hypothetical protein CSA15_09420 [Candidatus Delongbacteria bacterium]
MKKRIIFLLVVLIVISCSSDKKYKVREVDGVKIFHNKKPSNTDLKINLKELFTIPATSENDSASFSNGTILTVDKNEDIFILDTADGRVLRFDRNGKFIKSFGKKGMGPGEVQYPGGIACSNNKIYVAEQLGRKIVVFDYDGKYLKTITSDNGMPDNFIALDDGKFVGIEFGYRKEKSKEVDELKFTLYDSSFTATKLIDQKDIIFDPNDMEDAYLAFQRYAANSKGFFLSTTETDNYQIKFFDFEGNEKYRIKKGYISIPYSKEEIKSLKRWISRTANIEVTNLKNRYKYAVEALYTDGKNRVWAVNQWEGDIPDSTSFSIFEEGVFLKEVKLKLPLGKFTKITFVLSFNKNRIYVLNKTDMYLKVYSIY